MSPTLGPNGADSGQLVKGHPRQEGVKATIQQIEGQRQGSPRISVWAMSPNRLCSCCRSMNCASYTKPIKGLCRKNTLPFTSILEKNVLYQQTYPLHVLRKARRHIHLGDHQNENEFKNFWTQGAYFRDSMLGLLLNMQSDSQLSNCRSLAGQKFGT